MIPRTFIYGLVGLPLLITRPASAELSVAEEIVATKSSVIFIETSRDGDGQTAPETGTGIIISTAGYAITADHLVDIPNIRIEVTVGSRFGPKIVATRIPTGTGGADAALISLPQSLGPYHPVKFGDGARIKQGDTLITIGFPLNSDISPSVGIMSSLNGPDGLWQVSIPLNYGNSGGPVLNSDAELVGIVRGGIPAAQQINYVIPINLISPLIAMAGLQYPPFRAYTNDSAAPIPPSAIQRQNVSADVNPDAPHSGTDRKHCSYVTDVAPGLPPVFTKRLECSE